ncbi:MAG: thiol reductant ABC exporter subunit CydD [Microthrixaceae bacterium]
MRPFSPELLRALPTARRWVGRLAAVGVVSGVLALAQAAAVAWAATTVVRSAPLAVPLGWLAAIMAARGLTAAVLELVGRRAGHDLSGELRIRLLQRWLRSPPERRPAPAAAIGLAGAGAQSVEPYVARYLPALVTGTVVPILAVLALVWVDPLSAGILVLTLPLLPFFAALIGRHTEAETGRRWAAMHAMAGHFLDVVRGLPTLVAYGRAERQVGDIRAVGETHRRASVRTLRIAFMSSAALELLATISVAMVAVAVGLRLAHGSMDLQVGLTAILLAPEAYWPIRRVGQEFHNAADGAATLEAALPYLDADADVGGSAAVEQDAERPATGAPEVGVHGTEARAGTGVGVDRLVFGHRHRAPILDGLTLTCPPGSGLTVLTGRSGSGKSTLLDLIAGVRTPDGGRVVAGSAHLATQRPLVLPGPVVEVLRLGAPDATEVECEESLRVVGLWPALAERQGLQTRLGDDGFGLSAGQRSRLALARARLSRAPLLLLDEPTAHIDVDDADALRGVILDEARRRRVIVATHDRAFLSAADSHWELQPEPALPTPSAPSTADGVSSPGSTTPSPRNGGTLSWWQRRPVPDRLRLASLLGGLSMTAGVALTATSGWLIVQASTQPVVLTLLVAIVGVRAFGIARPVLRYAERVVSHDAALDTLAERRVGVYRALIPLAPARLGRRHRGDLLTAVVTDLDDAVDEQVRVTVPWWSTLIADTCAVAIAALVIPAAGMVIAAGAAASLAAARLGSRAESAAQHDAVVARGASLRVTTDLIDRLDQVRAVTGVHSPLDPPPLRAVAAALDRQGEAERRLIRSRALTLAGLWGVLTITVAATMLTAAAGLDAGAVSGPLAALVALTPIALADAWLGLAEVGGARARARRAELRIDDLLDQRPAIVDTGHLTLPDGVVPVTARGLSASWGDRQAALGPFTLPLLARGVRSQLTGPNGIGKSTMLAVLARQLTPTSGIHLLNGLPAADVALADARADIALVDDEPHAFAGSIRANLVLARPDAGDAELAAALSAVDLGVWLAQQPDGLDTPVGGLSGGERARLSIARAIVSRRHLVLLDEPAAHLDDATAERALTGLTEQVDTTIVAVSHRPLPVLDVPNPGVEGDSWRSAGNHPGRPVSAR